MGSLHLAFPSHTSIQYTIYSAPTSLNPAKERAAAAVLYPEFILQQYLQIPPVGEVRTPYFIGVKNQKGAAPKVYYAKLGGAKDAEELLNKLLSNSGLL